MTTYVDEGKDSEHAYQLVGVDGVTPVASVEALKYRVIDGVDVLIDWQVLSTSATTGTITIPGSINRVGVGNRKKRYLILFAVHDGGKHLPQVFEYEIKEQVGITPETVPM